jgi:predicted kinase
MGCDDIRRLAMVSEKTIVLLVGPKGAGKTHLGTRLEREAGIPFVRVEPIWLTLAGTERHDAATFDAAGQQRVLAAVASKLQGFPRVVLESTGTAPWFESFLAKLGSLGRVVIIRVRAPAALCLSRVRSRDGQDHIPVSDERILEINAIAESVQLAWAVEIDNTTKDDADDFIALVRAGGLG